MPANSSESIAPLLTVAELKVATGTSSGGGSEMTDKGGANGAPESMPKTTTGPAGAASKTESPPK